MLSGNMLRILQAVHEEDMGFEKLRKSTRISEKMLKNIVQSLEERGYVSVERDIIRITDHGKEILKKTHL